MRAGHAAYIRVDALTLDAVRAAKETAREKIIARCDREGLEIISGPRVRIEPRAIYREWDWWVAVITTAKVGRRDPGGVSVGYSQ